MKILDKYLIWTFCTLGCLYQLYSVTYQFVNFQVRSEVSFDYPRIVELPDIDIMIPMALAINLTELFIRYPDYMTKLCQIRKLNMTLAADNYENHCYWLREAPVAFSYELIPILTVNDIEQLTIRAVQNISELVLTESRVEILTKGFCDVSQFFSAIAIYLRLSCRNQTKPFTIDVRKYLVSGSNFAVIGHNLGNYFGFRYASFRNPCDINPNRYFIVKKAKNDLIKTFIRYKKTVSISLESPYESHCKNYDKPTTLWNCILSRSTNRKEESYLPRNVLINYGQFSGHLKFNSNREMNFCAKVIDKPECETISYETEGNTFPDHYDGDNIHLEPPLDPIVYYKTYPAFPPSEYIIFVSSIVGIWFGVSIAERLISGVNYLRTNLPKRKQIVHQDQVIT